MNTVIGLAGVCLRYGRNIVLDDLFLEVSAGEVLALLGPSGSGKSSLLRVIMGFLAPMRGVVRLRGELASDGSRILLLPEQRNLAVVFQDLALWPHLNVWDNLAFGLRSRQVDRGEARRRISHMLERVGLAGKESRYPGQLSGGEQQRVAIARALVLEPDAVLLDEPLSNLDLGLRHDLLDLFVALFREAGTTVVYVTHDPLEARCLGGGVALLDEGRIVAQGALDELDPQHESPFVRLVCRHLRQP